MALSLGRISVQSALGEPLRAEIDIPEINAEEAASLKASIALPEAFRAAGLEYNPAMASLQATLQRRPDGRAYIRIVGDRAINDPFVDMIMEARWASGRIVRDYTLLFDPPKARPAPSAPTQAQLAPQPPSRIPSAPAAAAGTKDPRQTTSSEPKNGAATVPVKAGDTAGKIASTTRAANVSLDQMLVAMLRANPEAFIGDNVNRIKAGSILHVPTSEQALATSAGEATRIIVAQSKDFNDFRRKLAGSVPTAQVAPTDRQVSGSVQARIEEKKPVPTAPDKLTLSKGSVQSKASEEQLANERNAKEAASRAAEIARNINELSKLGTASGTAPPSPPASMGAPVPEAHAAAVPSPVLPASAPAVASVAVAPPQAVASRPQQPLPVAPAEVTVLDDLIENPLVPAGAAGLIALLAAVGLYRVRQRKNAGQVDSAFLESRLRPDSFFGGSGGQSVDTNDGAATGSSMVYSPSQLDAVDDVDPVAEADVYLAYGRDIQAEEILKDALHSNPGRLAIYKKLLEIYAKRRDTHAFESIATQAFKLASTETSEWDRICDQGLSIDPQNPLYQPGGSPATADALPSSPAELDHANALQTMDEPQVELPPEPSSESAVDLDLDLDFSLDEEPVLDPASSNFGMATEVFERPEAPKAEAPANSIEFSLPDLEIQDIDSKMQALDTAAFKQQAATSFGSTGPAPLESAETPEAEQPESDLSMLEFDLESLSLDLGDTVANGDSISPEAHEDPLVTKLALAEEFRTIGDEDGARALIEEVISESSGEMKIKAQRALSHL